MTAKNRKRQGKDFERRVGDLFLLLGYKVNRNELLAGRQIDLVVELNQGPIKHTYIVECKDQSRPVTTLQYDSFFGRLLACKQGHDPKVRGIMVSSVGFVKEAKAQSRSHDIDLISISDLETSLIDFHPYITNLINNLSNDGTLQYFINPQIKYEHRDLPHDAFSAIGDWLADPEANHLTLLGDYGNGKTTLLKKVALKFAETYREEAIESGARTRIPIYIDLRDYTHAISLKHIILDLLETHSIRAPSYKAFEYLSQQGQLLILLDGFDEMASRGNHAVTLKNFRSLNSNAIGRSKIILSCRTHYFTSEAEVRRFHGETASISTATSAHTDLYQEIAGRRNFLILHLQEFSHASVAQYVRNRCKSDAPRVLKFINTTYNLRELSKKPVLLDMIVSSERAIASRSGPVTPGVLYSAYTEIWLSRNDWSVLLEPRLKVQLLREIAHRTSFEAERSLSYEKIFSLIRSWDPSIQKADTVEIDRELRTASFLVRDAEGNYRFSHRSFAEFFRSQYLLSEAAKGVQAKWGEKFTTEIYRFLRELVTAQKQAQDLLVSWLQDKSEIFGLPAEHAKQERLRAKINAIKVLSGLENSDFFDTLQDLVRTFNETGLRRAAAAALGHYDTEEATVALLRCLESEGDLFARTNATVSLARMSHPRARKYLEQFLEEYDEAGESGFIFAALCRAAPTIGRDEFIDQCIKAAPDTPNRKKIARAVIKCYEKSRHTSPENFCAKILQKSNSIKLITEALPLLSPEQRRQHLLEILNVFYRNLKSEYSSRIIDSLSGIGHECIGYFLLAIALGSNERHALSAIHVLRNDFPGMLRYTLRVELTHRPYTVQLSAARAYTNHFAPDGVDAIRNLLERPRLRVRAKIELIDILAEKYPRCSPPILEDVWRQEHAPKVKTYLMENLIQLDHERGLHLVTETGIRDESTGVRVAACALLGAETSDSSKKALLQALRDDDSKWVRMQALKSLFTPGRDTPTADIERLMSAEEDPDVESLKIRLVGHRAAPL